MTIDHIIIGFGCFGLAAVWIIGQAKADDCGCRACVARRLAEEGR